MPRPWPAPIPWMPSCTAAQRPSGLTTGFEPWNGPPDESKMTYLHNELDEAFRSGHETAIVFTQYTDTMDYLREKLRQICRLSSLVSP